MGFRDSAAAVALLAAMGAAGSAAAQAPARTGDDAIGRVVVFGDSLSDGGFFRAANPQLPAGAGSFTTNPDPVAPEVFATLLGLPLDPVYGLGGTNYAIGGARVSAPSGVTIPIAGQVSNFLAGGTTFRPDDLVYIQGGGNDYFAFVAGGGTNNALLTSAANDLAAQVRRVEAAGADRIVTLAVQTGGAAGLRLFNQTFASALASSGVNALYFDTDRLFDEIVASAPTFGITNVTGTACIGSSLTCTRATLVAPNANETYLLADSVHPAGITQRIQGQAIASLVKAPEQIAQLSYAAESRFRSQRDLAEPAMSGALAEPGGGRTVFGSVSHHDFSTSNSAQRIGLEEQALIYQIGVDLAFPEGFGMGVAASYASGDGDFEGGQGGYDTDSWSVLAYGRAERGRLNGVLDASYGRIGFEDLRRDVVLGPSVRSHFGETEGEFLSIRASAGLTLVETQGVRFGPEAAVSYERVKLDGYAEGGGQSTSATFGEQKLNGLIGRVGLAARSTTPLKVAARVSYEYELDDDDRPFTITPSGAPISYRSDVYRAERDYVSYAVSVSGPVREGLSVQAGVNGYAGRGDLDSLTASLGVSLAF